MTRTLSPDRRAYHKNWRGDKSDNPAIPHGTHVGYKRWRCSCPACKRMNNQPLNRRHDPSRPWVWGEDVVKFIQRAEPGITFAEMARILGCDESNVRRKRKPNAKMLEETADRWLTAFDLGYLLATGDIEVHAAQKNRRDPHLTPTVRVPSLSST